MYSDILVLGALTGILLGLAGTYTFVNKINYLAGAISHATMGGIGLALFVQSAYGKHFSVFYGALIFAVIFAGIISVVQVKFKDSDGIIGIAWAMGMSIGLLFLSLSPSFVDPSVYLFGNIMLISKNDIVLTAVMDMVAIVLFVVFYNRLVLKLSDEDFAKFSGINIGLYNLLILILLAVIITLMINVIGIILIIAMLSIPPAIARYFSNKLWQMALLTVILSISFNLAGIWLSIRYDINSGPSIVLFSSVMYFVALVFVKIKKKHIYFVLILSVSSVFITSCQSRHTRVSSGTCSSNDCITNICPNFIDSDGNICVNGSCNLENIPLRYQSENTTSTSDVSCGPTSVSMLLDGVLANSLSTSGWIDKYAQITDTYDPTNTTSACSNSKACRKIVAVEKEMIPSSDTEYAQYGASYEEVQDMLSYRADELDLSSHTANIVSQCTFASGTFKIDNDSQNFNIILYIRYNKTVDSTSTYNGVRLENISLASNNTSGGHFIAMIGYEVLDGKIFFKFNDPILGLQTYELRTVQTDTPFCVKELNGTCSLYQSISYSGRNEVSYLITEEGEEQGANYKYKVIINVSSIEYEE